MAFLNRMTVANLMFMVLALFGVGFGAYGVMSASAAGSGVHVLDGLRHVEELDVPPVKKQGSTQRISPEEKQGAGLPVREHSNTADQKRITPHENTNDLPQGNARMHGHIVNEHGDPVKGVTVTLRSHDTTLAPPQMRNGDVDAYINASRRFIEQSRRTTRTVTTDEHGAFIFEGLDDTQSYDVFASHQRNADGFLGNVSGGDSLSMVMETRVILRGRLLSDAGIPASFTVWVSDSNNMVSSSSVTVTGGLDTFELPIHGEGRFSVAVAARGFFQDVPPALVADGQDLECVVEIKRAGAIMGTVVDLSGAPLANATVTITGDMGAAATSRAQFGYFSGNLSTLNGNLNSWEAQSAYADSTYSKSAALSGIQWAAQTEVLEEALRKNYYMSNLGKGSARKNSMTAQTDSLGRYRFDSLKPGTFDVSVRYGDVGVPKDEANHPDSFFNKTIQVPAGEATCDFAIDAGARVVIRLNDPKGKPVTLQYATTMQENASYVNWVRLPDHDGAAAFRGMPVGRYIITMTATGYVDKKETVDVSAGMNEFSFVMRQGAFLSGKVVLPRDFTQQKAEADKATGWSSTSQPLYVRIRPHDASSTTKDHNAKKVGWNAGQFSYVNTTDGSYRIGPFEAGNWLVEVTTGYDMSAGGFVSQPAFLVEGENTLDLVMPELPQVNVTVYDDQGSTLKSVLVSLNTEDGRGNRQAYTEADGVARFTLVRPGKYILNAELGELSTAPREIHVPDAMFVGGHVDETLVLKAPNCVRITVVHLDTQASSIGLKSGDLIFLYNGQAINDYDGLIAAIGEARTSGTEMVSLSVERHGQVLTFTVRTGRLGIEGESFTR